MSLPDAVVIGGGLAGALAAEVLHRRGARVRVVQGQGTRASDAPCAIVHPFVGGSFAPRPNVEQAWRAAQAWFSRRAEFVRPEVVRRHLPRTRPGERLLGVIERADQAMYKAKVGGRNRLCIAQAASEGSGDDVKVEPQSGDASGGAAGSEPGNEPGSEPGGRPNAA